MKRLLGCLAGLACMAAAQAAPSPSPNPNALRQLDAAIAGLIAKVGPSVVEIEVSGFGAVSNSSDGDTGLVIGPERDVGAGFVIDPDGYIVTNAHVVQGGEQFDVVLPLAPGNGPMQSLSQRGIRLKARLIGVATDIDLAVLKVDGEQLPPLPLARYTDLHQGELVLAFGSPGGLANSVSMGVVSATARQPDPDSALVYIQTDAAINPGNSGGPLVNASGEVVGVDTFILSQSGGNEGLGFALPSNIVRVSFDQIKKYGHVRRAQIGISVQTISDTLASALHLPRNNGLIVSDVVPDSAADHAGLRIGDLLVSVDGRVLDSVPQLMFYMMSLEDGAHLQLQVLRGGQPRTLDVLATVPPYQLDTLAAAADPQQSLIRPLGILAVELPPHASDALPGLRVDQGLLVVAHTAGFSGDVPLQVNDIIVAINGQPVPTLAGLRTLLAALAPGSPLAVQVQRSSQLMFLAFGLPPS